MADHETISLKEFFEEKFKGIEKEIKSQWDHTNTRFDSLSKILIDRDNRYDEREVSNKEAIKSAFNSSEKAAEKTEMALKEYKIASNEWRDTVKDLVGTMITRPDVERELNVLSNQISELKEYKNKVEGKIDQQTEKRTQSNWSIGLLIVTILSLFSLVIGVINIFLKH